jgi:hypothetical protein
MPAAAAIAILFLVSTAPDMGLLVNEHFPVLRDPLAGDRNNPVVVRVTGDHEIRIWQEHGHAIRLYHAASDWSPTAATVKVFALELTAVTVITQLSNEPHPTTIPTSVNLLS